MSTIHFHQNERGTIDSTPCDIEECPRLVQPTRPMVSFIRWQSGETWEWHPANNIPVIAHIVAHALEGNAIA